MNSKEYISSGIIESYILGLASPEEAGILECVMMNNAEVKAAFEETQKILEDLATKQAVDAPSGLKDKIWDTIQTQKPAEKSAEKKSPEYQESLPINISGSKKPKEQWRNWGIAASVLLLISVSGNILLMNQRDDINTQIANLQNKTKSQQQEIANLNQKTNILSSPNVQKIVLKGVANHENESATVYWDQTTKEVYLNADALPSAPEGMQYQLWALENGKPVNAGMYTEEKDSRIALANISEAQAFAITLEKQGGSDAPTMENMFVLGEL